jgi:hypothetical protein
VCGTGADDAAAIITGIINRMKLDFDLIFDKLTPTENTTTVAEPGLSRIKMRMTSLNPVLFRKTAYE